MSMELILEKARELGEMLAESEAYKELGRLEESAMANTEIEGMYTRYAALRERMAEEEESASADSLKNELEELEAELSQHPQIKALQIARTRFGGLMEQVNRVLQIALEGGESSCGEGGCASCQGCSVR
ncbi:MAG: YlbF family regulator [Christensenellales bacterium]|jgi:cell fate (sporulation/competence/biofilm development) regulator YlbF (YheA/YmcA/DUF963 family)